jgi:hypothetical protein
VKRCFLLLFLLALAPLTITSFSACGNSQRETSSLALDACVLLSKEEVSDILNREFAEPNHQVREDDNGDIVLSSCTFVPADRTSFISLNLLVRPEKDVTDPGRAIAEHIGSLKQGLGDPDFSMEDITGVGEAAAYAPSTGQMVVYDKHRLFVLTLHPRSGTETQTILTRLATAALAD